MYHHFLNQLRFQHITNLSQLILPNGTQLMNDAEYQTYDAEYQTYDAEYQTYKHHKPTKTIYSAQKLLKEKGR
jgi:hypothetical protein